MTAPRPSWQLSQAPDVDAVLGPRCAEILEALRRAAPAEQRAFLLDSRAVHRQLFHDLVPEGAPWCAGTWRGQTNTPLESTRAVVRVPSGAGLLPRVPVCPPDQVLARISRLAVRIRAVLGAREIDDLTWLGRCGRILHDFFDIHPYLDGNGHVGRLMMAVLAHIRGVPVSPAWTVHPAPYGPAFSLALQQYPHHPDLFTHFLRKWFPVGGTTAGASIRLNVVLDPDRARAGALSVVDGMGTVIAGPMPVWGQAGPGLAAETGNPERDPRHRRGDTPTGLWRILRVVESPPTTPVGMIRGSDGLATYGHEGVMILTPVAGMAREAAETGGRTSLWLHGGDLDDDGRPRPTRGALRLRPADMAALVTALLDHAATAGVIEAGCEIVEGAPEGVDRDLRCAEDTADPGDDPPPASLADTAVVLLDLSGRGLARSGDQPGTVAPGTMGTAEE